MLSAAFNVRSLAVPSTISATNLCFGLFGMRQFRDPETLLRESHETVRRCNRLISKCLESPLHLPTIVRRLDTLSEMICFIIDASELIRNVHPDPNWRSAAQQSYSMLGNLINQLNTHTGLYNALDASIQQSARANHTGISEETLAVARLFHSDFVKSGARLGQSKRSDLVRINDRINTLGHEFMTLSSYRRGEYPDNSILKLEEMLQERFKLAKLLGYPSYAHLFLADKMAKTPENVMSYLQELSARNRPLALECYSRGSVGSVIQGASNIFRSFFGIEFHLKEPDIGETWHPSVKRLDIVNFDDGQKLGTIYCDLFRRDQDGLKCPAPSQFTVRCHRRIDFDEEQCFPDTHYEDLKHLGLSSGGKRQLPVLVLSCDFPPPKSEIGPLLSFSDVETLMHELGHAIHSVLAQTDYQHVSGTRCKLDFVETPSILMEIIAKDQWSVERLRDVYVQKTVDMVGTASMRSPSRSTEAIDDPIERQQQIFLSILDQKYHGELVPHSFDSTAVYESVMVQHQVYPFNSCAQNQRSFNHLFNYGSIYYSYLWCRSLAYSIYRHLFWENFRSDNSSGIRRAGEIINEEMLKYGGSKDPWSMNWERLRGGSPGLNRT